MDDHQFSCYRRRKARKGFRVRASTDHLSEFQLSKVHRDRVVVFLWNEIHRDQKLQFIPGAAAANRFSTRGGQVRTPCRLATADGTDAVVSYALADRLFTASRSASPKKPSSIITLTLSGGSAQVIFNLLPF